MRNFKNLMISILIVFICFFTACSEEKKVEKKEIHTVENISALEADSSGDVRVIFEIQDYGNFTVETYPDSAPESVERFLELVDSGYYDGMEFEYLYPENYIITSDKTALSSGECKDIISGEFKSNGYSNNIPIDKGTLAFYHLPGEYNTAKAKFMIFLSDNKDMEGSIAAFAKIVEGNELFDKIISVPIKADNTPVSPIVMKKVYISD